MEPNEIDDDIRGLIVQNFTALAATIERAGNMPRAQAERFDHFIRHAITPLAEEFVRTHDETHIGVIEFRMRTFLRDVEYETLQLADEAIIGAITGTVHTLARLLVFGI